MRVYAYPADPWGCGSYRVKWPAEAVRDIEGVDVQVAAAGQNRGAVTIDPSGRVLNEALPRDADVIVMQRPTSAHVVQVIRMLRDRGVAVVIDMDDDLSRIDPRNPAHRAMSPMVKVAAKDRFTGQMVTMQRPNLHSFHHAAEACKLATLVTVTTPALAKRYGAHGRVRVVPNFVPAHYLEVPHDPASDLVGWGGSVHSHPDDLQQIGPAVARLRSSIGLRFETVGDPKGVGRALGLGDDPVSPGAVPIEEWPAAIAQFGVGLAPLAPTQFNQAKSRLKPLEYAAVGVPSVVSPAADYTAWAQEARGSCVVVSKPRAWEAAIRLLVTEPARRAELSEVGRQVAGDHTIEGNAWRWAEAWAAAFDIEHARVPAGAT